MGRECWVHEDGSFGGYLTPEEIAEQDRQLAEHYGQLSEAELEQLREGALAQDAIFQRPHEDVIAWIMRTRGVTFPEAVLFANELLEDGGSA